MLFENSITLNFNKLIKRIELGFRYPTIFPLLFDIIPLFLNVVVKTLLLRGQRYLCGTSQLILFDRMSVDSKAHLTIYNVLR